MRLVPLGSAKPKKQGANPGTSPRKVNCASAQPRLENEWNLKGFAGQHEQPSAKQYGKDTNVPTMKGSYELQTKAKEKRRANSIGSGAVC